IPPVEGTVGGVEPDRLEPNGSRPVRPGQRDFEWVAEGVRRIATAAEDAAARRVEYHQHAVVPEGRAVRIDILGEFSVIGVIDGEVAVNDERLGNARNVRWAFCGR